LSLLSPSLLYVHAYRPVATKETANLYGANLD
jgi:hypothetical protein